MIIADRKQLLNGNSFILGVSGGGKSFAAKGEIINLVDVYKRQMNNGGDAAEQVVRLSLEGFEVAARLSGSAAKNIALLLVSVLKQEQKTKGKARLTNMIKSGKELKVFSIPQKDLKKFTVEMTFHFVVNLISLTQTRVIHCQ